MLHRFAAGLGGHCFRCHQPPGWHTHVLDDIERVAAEALGPLPGPLQVSCFGCGAPEGERCRTRSGRPTHPRSIRLDDMRQARRHWFVQRAALDVEAQGQAKVAVRVS